MINDPPIIILILILIINLFLGFLTYFKKKGDLISKIFLGISLSTGIWMAGLLIMMISENFSLVGGRITFAGASLIPLFFLLFSIKFSATDKSIFNWPLVVLIIIGMTFFFFSLFTPHIVAGEVSKEGQFGFTASFGALYPYFGVYFIIFILGGLFNFIYKLKTTKNKLEKTQINFFLLGSMLSICIGSLTNLLFPLFLNICDYSGLGPFASIFFVGFTSYTIVRHRLMNVRVILTEFLVGIVGIILLVELFSSRTVSLIALKTGIFIAFIYLGYELIKSTLKEIQRRQEIEKIDRAKSEFISIASHQLRTPLTAVKGYISMILEGVYGKLSGKQIKPLENVYYSNERLIKLVNDLLSLSRLDAGKIEFSPKPTSLEEMVSGIVEELKINAERKGLYMKMVKPEMSLPKIMADQDKIRQVILNIVDNAIKYTKKGGITIELKKLDDEERIRISDTGEGMTKHEIDSLFQMFSRATAGTQLHAEGAGLGLYVAKQFIEMHGGKIWAESPGKGKGSTFIIKLPVHLDPKLLKAKTKTITKQPDDFF